MGEEMRPNKERLLAAFSGGTADRVPNWEFTLMRRNTRAIIGDDALADVEARYRKLDTVWPARSDSEREDRSALASYSCYLPPDESLSLLEATGQDATVCTLSWKPKSRSVEREGIIARGQDGIIEGRSDLDLLPEPPSPEEMMVPLDHYLDAFEGSAIGVGVLLRSVFCNTYETLGIENFMLKMYDDPGIIEILFDRFYEYSLRVAELVAERNVDFLAIDDDLCDNAGFMVNPDFIRDTWMWRTSRIMEPCIAAGKPIVFHCCGNVSEVIPMAIEMGISAIHPIQPNCNDIYAYKKEFGGNICLIGNIDLAGALTRGTPMEVAEDSKRHLELLAPGGGYVLCSSHSVTDDVPPENYRAMIDAAHQFEA